MQTSNRVWVRVVLLIYTMGLLTATHWPGLTIRGPVDRTDLIIHAGVFFWWTVLLYNARWLGVDGTLKRRIVWTGVVSVCFAGFDELTQPMFSRVADWWDFGADSFGALVACSVIWWWSGRKKTSAKEQQGGK